MPILIVKEICIKLKRRSTIAQIDIFNIAQE